MSETIGEYQARMAERHEDCARCRHPWTGHELSEGACFYDKWCKCGVYADAGQLELEIGEARMPGDWGKK